MASRVVSVVCFTFFAFTGGASRAEAPDDAAWSAQVGDKVFSLPVSLLERPDDAKYYYAAGSSSALTAEMKRHRVGGDGRWHIFHLPEGPSMLELPSGSRRDSFSSLVQLQNGQVLASAWPEYPVSTAYEHPGSEEAQEREHEAVNEITPSLFQDYLSKVTSLDADGVSTRSYSNALASNTIVSFLQQQFEGMGLSTCLQRFSRQGQHYANVVAYKPGSSRDTLTIGAHYDSRPFRGSAPGANDNGSGVAALLSLAKVLTGMNVNPVRDLFFVGFAAEEPGLLGSSAFVPALEGHSESPIPAGCQPQAESFLQKRKTGVQHKAIILDEVGWRSTNEGFSTATVQFESKDASNELMSHLAQSNKLHNGAELKATHSDHPFGSDHMPFINDNLEAVLVINGDDEAYPDYHKSTDTMANVDTDYASKVVKAVMGGMLRTAGLQL